MSKSIYRSEAGRQLLLERYQEILSEWPVANRQYSVATSQGETFIIESGDTDNPPLLMFHGSVSNSFAWIGDIERLSQDFRVYCVDLIGEAGRSAPERPTYESGAYAIWLGEVADQLDLQRFALGGLSLGGWMALEFATKHPHRVENLVLLCPGGLVREYSSFLFKALFYMCLGEWGKQRISRLVNGGELPEDEGMQQALDFVNLIGQHFRPRTAKLPLFSDDALRALQMPVLILCGENDWLIPPHDSLARLQAVAPDVAATLLPDTGHVVANQADTIVRFLADHRLTVPDASATRAGLP